MTITVQYVTLEFNDPGANSHKFYRCYSSDDGVAVFQWGRVGAVGQWSAQKLGSAARAISEADDKALEKQSKGYQVTGRGKFDINWKLDPGNKDSLVRLDAARGPSTPASSPASPPRRRPAAPAQPPAAPAPTPAPTDPSLSLHEAFSTRALAAITVAAGDPNKALVELAVLNEQWRELEQAHAKAASYLATLNRLVLGAPETISI